MILLKSHHSSDEIYEQYNFLAESRAALEEQIPPPPYFLFILVFMLILY